MSEYTITMKRSPHINDAERRRRLYEAYTLLLSLSERAKAIGQHDSADSSQAMASDALVSQQEPERDHEHVLQPIE